MKITENCKKCLVVILLFVFLISNLSTVSVNAQSNAKDIYTSEKISDNVPNEAKNYAKNNYLDVLEVVKEYIGDFNIDLNELNEAKLGEPYVIYNVDSETQSAIYYFPIETNENKVILVMSIMDTTNGWSYSLDQDMVNELNDINYASYSKNFIFYQEDEQVYAEESKSKSKLCKYDLLGKHNDSNQNEFDNMIFQDKVDYIANAINNKIRKSRSRKYN